MCATCVPTVWGLMTSRFAISGVRQAERGMTGLRQQVGDQLAE
jgi:hypothetical protein